VHKNIETQKHSVVHIPPAWWAWPAVKFTPLKIAVH